jgi:ribosomal protein S12 methylthiotransferase
MDVLVDDAGADGVIARSSADAPEIDGLVHVTNRKRARVGELLRVRITDCDVHDLYAEALPACKSAA